jgi:hypothetical protein
MQAELGAGRDPSRIVRKGLGAAQARKIDAAGDKALVVLRERE